MSNAINIQLDKLKGLPVKNPITPFEYLKQPINPAVIGPLNSAQVKGLIGQLEASNNTTPTSTAVDGIGIYALPALQLEQAGFLKTGTTETYLKSGGDAASVLNSPAVWTGKNGISTLARFFESNTQQASAAFSVLQFAYSSMVKQGIFSGANVNSIAAMLYGSARFNIETMILWSKGQVSGALVTSINTAAKQGTYAISFVNDLPLGTSGQGLATGFTQVTNRKLIDTVVSNILNNNKIPRPRFG